MKLREWTVREYLALGAVVAVIAVVLCGWALQSRRQAAAAAAPPPGAETFVLPAQGDGEDEAARDDNAPPSPAPAAPAPEKLTVYVTGAVKQPGVYLLKPGSHVYQAIHAAGGFKTNARQDALNLAEAVRDADQINVPTKATFVAATTAASPRRSSAPAPPVVAFAPLPSRRSEPTAPRATPFATIIPGSREKEPREKGRVLGLPPVPVVGPTPKSATPPAASAEEAAFGGETRTASAASSPSSSSEKFRSPGDGTVHLNTATSEELQKLPGVGPSTAEKILAYRQQIGRFTDPRQLMDVRGIGEKKYAKMEAFLAL